MGLGCQMAQPRLPCHHCPPPVLPCRPCAVAWRARQPHRAALTGCNECLQLYFQAGDVLRAVQDGVQVVGTLRERLRLARQSTPQPSPACFSRFLLQRGQSRVRCWRCQRQVVRQGSGGGAAGVVVGRRHLLPQLPRPLLPQSYPPKPKGSNHWQLFSSIVPEMGLSGQWTGALLRSAPDLC